MAKKLEERHWAQIATTISECNNYCIVTDRGIVLFNEDIKPEKMAFLESVLKDCVNKYLGIRNRGN